MDANARPDPQRCRGGSYRSSPVATPDLCPLLLPAEAPATGTTIAPELKSLEIMRKFSEQYAQR
jgi:hypothetical protein